MSYILKHLISDSPNPVLSDSPSIPTTAPVSSEAISTGSLIFVFCLVLIVCFAGSSGKLSMSRSPKRSASDAPGAPLPDYHPPSKAKRTPTTKKLRKSKPPALPKDCPKDLAELKRKKDELKDAGLMDS